MDKVQKHNSFDLFSVHHRFQSGSGAHPASYQRAPRLKWPGREADCLLPSSAEVKNTWKYASIPPVCLYGMVFYYAKNNFTLIC
jgi:hypothetical protein